jgi:4-amino-4-deoxy-L-arabinose transferase-like glycosyltransferase
LIAGDRLTLMHLFSPKVWRRAAHPLLIVFVLALALRLINLAFLPSADAFFAEDDTFDYWQLGAKLAQPGEFWPALVSITARMPLYPLLIAGIRSTFGDAAPWVVALLQAVIDAGTCSLIAALGALISPLVGLIAGVLAALSVTLIVFSTQILTDTLFLFFFTLMLLAGAQFARRPGNGLATVAGLAGGIALATRPAIALLLAAAVPVVFAIVLRTRRRFTPALAAALLFAGTAAAPVVPVLLRNVIHYGSFDLTSQTGDHLAMWIVPLVAQRADGTPYHVTLERMEARYQERGLPVSCSLRKLDCAAEGGLDPHANPFRRAAIRTEVAREEMARLPLSAYVKAWLDGMVVNLASPALLGDPRVRALPKPSFYATDGASLWERSRAYLFAHPGRYQLVLLVGLVAMLPFLMLEAIGFVMLARTRPWAALFAGGVLAYFLLITGPVAAPKYRLPMEPVLIVLAALPLAWLVRVMTAAVTRCAEPGNNRDPTF